MSKIDFSDENVRKKYRHTASHILAQAVKHLYPDAKLAIGPAIKDGFYYDFDLEHKFTDEDLRLIEKEIKKIIKQALPLEKFVLGRDEALALMKDEPYKIELINDLDDSQELSFYKQGDFTDLCAGDHMEKTSDIKAVKLLSTSGSYWRGDSDNKMLQRIYGTAFPSTEELNAYITKIEEAKKRDHRLIGKEMNLFEIFEEGPGFPFFLPDGMIIRNELEHFWRNEHTKHGYQEIKTPLMLSQTLWENSGHYDHYKDNMYFTKIDEMDFAVKPMNCPGAMLTYKNKLHSYRDFPLRYAELGQVHRHELSGALHGLMRVRTFTQDDAHIFMLESQIKDEIKNVISFIDEVYKVFGFKYRIELSTKPEKFMGDEALWQNAENILEESMKDMKLDFSINEGDGAFYGPKLDFHIEDSLERTWQCATVQLDFQMPERFDLNYVGEDNEKHRPVMIHRVIFGSIERFIGIITEHFGGKFPLWLAPTQIKILTVTDAVSDYAKSLYETFLNEGFRVKLDDRNEKIGYKIREGRNKRDSYLLIIGENEKNDKTITVRSSKKGDLGTLATVDFIKDLKKEIETRAI